MSWEHAQQFSVSTSTPEPDLAVVVVHGDIDMVTCPDLTAELEAVLADGPAEIRLDLRRVRLLSSAGLACLVHLHRRCEDEDRHLSITADEPVLRKLALTGLDMVLPLATPGRGTGQAS